MANILIGGVNLKTLGMHDGVANAKDYGARADDTYDNYGIAQTLATALATTVEGGSIVYPISAEGARYRFTQGVVVPAPHTVSFIGTGGVGYSDQNQGGYQSTLWLDSATPNDFLIKYNNETADRSRGMRIAHLKLVGNASTAGTATNQSAIIFAGHNDGHEIKDVTMLNLSGYAIAHDPNIQAVYSQNSRMDSVTAWNCGGFWGPTEEYISQASLNYAGTIFEWSNIAAESLGWTNWNQKPKPFVFDLRSTRALIARQFNIEGAIRTISLTDTSISFTAPDTIGDTNSGLGIFSVGDHLRISGAGAGDNAGLCVEVATVSAGTITIKQGPEEPTLVNQSAGGSVTLTYVPFSIFAWMTGTWWLFDSYYYEYTTNQPAHALALFGRTAQVGADGQKYIHIRNAVVPSNAPIWFENDSTNEVVVKLDHCGSDATDISELVVFEDGVDTNPSGRLEIDWLDGSHLGNAGIPDSYYGRVMVKSCGINQQSRMLLSQGRAKCLMKWNANMGSLYGQWGQVRVTNAGHTASSAIEPDDQFLVHRFTGGSTNNLSSVRFTVLGDNAEGAVVTIAYKYRLEVDAADDALKPDLYTDGNHFADALVRVGVQQKNTAGYVVGTMQALMLSNVSDPNRWAELRPLTTAFSVATVLRIAAVEVWLGEPDNFDLTPARNTHETATGTFTCDPSKEFTDIDSSAGAVTATLPDGIRDGQRKKVTMSDATTSSTLSVTSHETSDPEVFTFAATTDVLILEWDAANAFWWTVKNIGVAV